MVLATILTILILTVFGAILAAVIGTLWYLPKTPMGKIHMRALGFDTLSPEAWQQKMLAAKPAMKRRYAGQFLLSLLTAFAVVFIMVMSLNSNVSLGLAIGFVMFNWLCFMVPIVGTAILWSDLEKRLAWKKFFSDISSNLVIVIAIALMTSLFV